MDSNRNVTQEIKETPVLSLSREEVIKKIVAYLITVSDFYKEIDKSENKLKFGSLIQSFGGSGKGRLFDEGENLFKSETAKKQVQEIGDINNVLDHLADEFHQIYSQWSTVLVEGDLKQNFQVAMATKTQFIDYFYDLIKTQPEWVNFLEEQREAYFKYILETNEKMPEEEEAEQQAKMLVDQLEREVASAFLFKVATRDSKQHQFKQSHLELNKRKLKSDVFRQLANPIEEDSIPTVMDKLIYKRNRLVEDTVNQIKTLIAEKDKKSIKDELRQLVLTIQDNALYQSLSNSEDVFVKAMKECFDKNCDDKNVFDYAEVLSQCHMKNPKNKQLVGFMLWQIFDKSNDKHKEQAAYAEISFELNQYPHDDSSQKMIKLADYFSKRNDKVKKYHADAIVHYLITHHPLELSSVNTFKNKAFAEVIKLITPHASSKALEELQKAERREETRINPLAMYKQSPKQTENAPQLTSTIKKQND